DIGAGGRYRLLHHVAQVAGHRHLALAGHHRRFDGEQFATHIGPGETRDHADLIDVFDLAIPELRHADEVGDALGVDHDRLLLRKVEILHRHDKHGVQRALEVS